MFSPENIYLRIQPTIKAVICVCLPPILSIISTAIRRVHFTLGGCITRDPGKCSVGFGAIWTRDMFNILITFNRKQAQCTPAVDVTPLWTVAIVVFSYVRNGGSFKGSGSLTAPVPNGHTLWPATPPDGQVHQFPAVNAAVGVFGLASRYCLFPYNRACTSQVTTSSRNDRLHFGSIGVGMLVIMLGVMVFGHCFSN